MFLNHKQEKNYLNQVINKQLKQIDNLQMMLPKKLNEMKNKYEIKIQEIEKNHLMEK